MVAHGVSLQGKVWLFGAVVCLNAACTVSSLTRVKAGSRWPHN